MRRILALDIGSVRIGVAVSDIGATFAQALAVLQADGEWMEELASLAEEHDAGTILVGMPRRTDGSEGPEAVRVAGVVRLLAARFPGMEIKTWDERFTTVIANQALLQADVSRAGRKQRVDKVAAALLLQSYLDSLAGAGASAAFPMPDPGSGCKPKRRGGRKRSYK